MKMLTFYFISASVVRVPGPTVDGAQSDNFIAAVKPPFIPGATYAWVSKAQSPFGNNPQVPFAKPSQPTTTVTNAHWYAHPDSRLAREAKNDCTYEINFNVTAGGQTVSDKTWHPWHVVVPMPAGETPPLKIIGMPTVAVKDIPSGRQWYVTGMGTLKRSDPVVKSHIPKTSQFYNKIITVHEGRHVTQLTVGVPGLTVNTLWNATALYNGTIKNLTSSISQAELIGRINLAIANQNSDDRITYEKQVPALEQDAHAQSNQVGPHYLEPF